MSATLIRSLAQTTCIACCLLVSIGTTAAWANPQPEHRLWPEQAPNETGTLEPERNISKPDDHQVAGQSVIRLGNVSQPTLQFYPAAAEKNTGTTVVVFPGGGYNILAMDLEGTEVCQWLNSIGVNAALVKYRVPRREGREKHDAPLQDAQRAIGIARHRANEWKINPDRIGVLGFSAGGHLAATASLNYQQRTYTAIDAADQVSCRPDFSILIYPAYLLSEDPKQLAKEMKITSETPPTFLVMTQDDPIDVRNVLVYASSLQEQKIPFELHVFPRGGHGYGLRPTEMPVSGWPRLVEDWMRQSKWLP